MLQLTPENFSKTISQLEERSFQHTHVALYYNRSPKEVAVGNIFGHVCLSICVTITHYAIGQSQVRWDTLQEEHSLLTNS